MTHHCEECGRYIDKDISECPECGAELDIPENEPSTTAMSAPDREPKRLKVYALIGLKLAVAQLIIGLILVIPHILLRTGIEPLARGTGSSIILIAVIGVYAIVGLVVAGKVVYMLYGWE